MVLGTGDSRKPGSVLEIVTNLRRTKTMVNNYDNLEEVNKFVGILDNETYVFLDKLFSYDSGLHGATGTRIVPVSEEYVEERIEEVKDYDYSPVAHIYDEQDTPEGWDEWISNWSQRELEDLVIDPSGGQYWDKAKEVCEKFEAFEFYTTDCIGGGRMFSDSREANPDNYEYLENPELLEMARQAENGEYFD
jgi:hypothetical protein